MNLRSPVLYESSSSHYRPFCVFGPHNMWHSLGLQLVLFKLKVFTNGMLSFFAAPFSSYPYWHPIHLSYIPSYIVSLQLFGDRAPSNFRNTILGWGESAAHSFLTNLS